MKIWKKTLLSLGLVLTAVALFLPAQVWAEEELLLDGGIGVTEETSPETPESQESQADSDLETETDDGGTEEAAALTAPVLTGAETVALQDNGGNWYSAVNVTWESVEGAEKYQILRRTEDGDWETAGYSSEISYEDSDVTICTDYVYTVCCVDADSVPCSPYDEDGVSVYYPSGSCGEEVSWKLVSENVLEITGSGPMYDTYNMEQAPWYVLRQYITKAQVGEGITHLSGYAFQGCTELKEVSLPESLTSMGCYTFFNCTALETVDLPQGIAEIPERAFYRCSSLGELVLPDGLTAIGKGAFDGCSKLTGLTLPDGLTEIGASAFSDCKKLTRIDIPQGVTALGLNTFYGCAYLEEITFPEGFTTLGAYALSGCSSLTSLEFPESLTSLGTGALRGCSALETIFFRGSCPEMSGESFPTGCEILTYYPMYDQSWTDARRQAVDADLVWIGWTPSTGAVQRCATPVLTAANYTGGVRISWGSVRGAEKYRVFRWNAEKNKWSTLATTDQLNYVDTTAASGTSYCYTVRCLVDGKYASGYDLEGKTVCYLTAPEVKVSNAAGGVKVTWTETAGAEKYVVYRKLAGGKWESLTTVKAGEKCSYLDAGVENESGNRYYYTVRAVKGDARSDYVKNVSLYRLTQPTVKAASASKGVTVTWSQSNGAESYRVYRKTGSSGWKLIATVTGEETLRYSDTSAQSGTTYIYTVRAQKSGTLSSYLTSGAQVTYLTQPTVSVSNGSTGVNISWNKISGADGYRVYRKTPGGSWSRIATIKGGDTLQYTDKEIAGKNGTTYLYTVRAVKGSALSSYHSGKSIIRLTRPSISQLSNSSSGKLTVQWGKNSKATGYQIQYATSSGFSGAKTVTVTSGSTVKTTISGLTKGKTYYVRVRTVCTSGGVTSYSAWSSTKSLKLTK
ncbi:MAG: leucine-rich repeat protein [Candidatus Onthomonas sp.]